MKRRALRASSAPGQRASGSGTGLTGRLVTSGTLLREPGRRLRFRLRLGLRTPYALEPNDRSHPPCTVPRCPSSSWCPCSQRRRSPRSRAPTIPPRAPRTSWTCSTATRWPIPSGGWRTTTPPTWRPGTGRSTTSCAGTSSASPIGRSGASGSRPSWGSAACRPSRASTADGASTRIVRRGPTTASSTSPTKPTRRASAAAWCSTRTPGARTRPRASTPGRSRLTARTWPTGATARGRRTRLSSCATSSRAGISRWRSRGPSSRRSSGTRTAPGSSTRACPTPPSYRTVRPSTTAGFGTTASGPCRSTTRSCSARGHTSSCPSGSTPRPTSSTSS